MPKSTQAFRTISEVADDLDIQKHVLRFWESKFTQLKPMKRGGGRRYYRPEDVELLQGIHHLLRSQAYTIKGVQRILREQGAEYVKACWQTAAGGPAARANPPAASPKAGLLSRRRTTRGAAEPAAFGADAVQDATATVAPGGRRAGGRGAEAGAKAAMEPPRLRDTDMAALQSVIDSLEAARQALAGTRATAKTRAAAKTSTPAGQAPAKAKPTAAPAVKLAAKRAGKRP